MKISCIQFTSIIIKIAFFLLFSINFVCSIADGPLVLLISLDGLRHDFITPELTPNIYQLAQKGVFAPQGVKSQVSTVTSANHHSLATGLYQESHGILDNVFYDPVFDEYFDNWNITGNGTAMNRSVLLQWHRGVEPVWRTNMQIKGHLTGCYRWPLCDVEYDDAYHRNHKCLVWKDYGNLSVWKTEIDGLIGWFTHEKEPINFGMYYNAQPDHAEHENDIFGANVSIMIREVDQSIGYLIEKSKSAGIFDKLNFILTADHGHSNVMSPKFLFNLEKYVDFSMVKQSSASFFPLPNTTAEEIYANLTRAIDEGVHISVWYKSEFPEKYHWKNNRRVGPVIYFYDNHYQNDAMDVKKNRNFPYGTHGYLNDFDEMNPFFVAFGPVFRKNYVVEGLFLENIDIYPLICQILGLKPVPNNGSLNRIGQILINFPPKSSIFFHWAYFLVVFFCILMPLILFFILLRFIYRFFQTNFHYMRLKDCSANVFYSKKSEFSKRNSQKLSNDQKNSNKFSTNGGYKRSAGENLAAGSVETGATGSGFSATGQKPLVLLENELRSSDEDEL